MRKGDFMESIYGLGVLRNKNSIFGFPMPLEVIDSLTTKYSLEELLNKLEQSNVIADFHKDNVSLAIVKKVNGKWIVDHYQPIIKDALIIEYDLKDIPVEMQTTCANILYNHFVHFLTKDQVRVEMKNAIRALKKSWEEFCIYYENLSYVEKRHLKNYLASKVNFQELQHPKQINLKRTMIEETKVS